MIYKGFNIEENKKELICFVGGGGKTTAMFKLAKELRKLGKSVLVTTTTAIFYPDKKDYDRIVVTKDKFLGALEGLVNKEITVLGREVTEESKLLGVDKDFVEEIYLSNLFDYILVEGDGSKGRPVKAPAEHEPVIPESTTKVIGVIGLDCIGKKIGEEYVHRPELFIKITESKTENIINVENLLKLIKSESGIFKSVPKKCERILVLNKVEGKEREKAALSILDKIIEEGINIDCFIAGSLLGDRYLKLPNEGIVTAVIMASGFSRRMKRDKLMLSVEGVPCVERVIKSVCQSDADEIILVYQSHAVRNIGEKYGVKTIYNEYAHLGQSQAVKLGVIESNEKTKGFIFLTGDQPFVNKEVINKVVDCFKRGSYDILIPTFDGKRGNPVIFSSKLKEELLKLEGDIGGRAVIEKYSSRVKFISIEDKKSGLDMDTMEDYLLIRDGDETS
jgi:probable selenium-dependent hydroxylase accessory protein YqeC/molybdenum cofactor cytidylyltransferase